MGKLDTRTSESGDEVICPKHKAMFQIPTGHVMEQPAGYLVDCAPTNLYKVRVIGEDIEIEI